MYMGYGLLILSPLCCSCDCVGILKERNVDVEHRFKAVMSRGRKKSTKCRLVFRTFVTLPNGTQEVLQVVSQPIACSKYIVASLCLLVFQSFLLFIYPLLPTQYNGSLISTGVR